MCPVCEPQTYVSTGVIWEWLIIFKEYTTLLIILYYDYTLGHRQPQQRDSWRCSCSTGLQFSPLLWLSMVFTILISFCISDSYFDFTRSLRKYGPSQLRIQNWWIHEGIRVKPDYFTKLRGKQHPGSVNHYFTTVCNNS